MTRVPVDSPENEDRRIVDARWKAAVDKKLSEGAEKFQELADGQELLSRKLDENTITTNAIKQKMDDHVNRYDEFTAKLQPVVDAMGGMRAGVHAIGVFGEFVAWCGRSLRKIVVWLAPIFAFGMTIWAFLHERSADAWHAIVDIFK